MAAAVCLGSVPASAAEPDFGYVYTAHTEEAGETELSLWATDRRGKSPGDYAAQDYRLEVERGITDRFQTAIYAEFAGHQIRNLAPEFEPVHRGFAFQGLTAEFIYAVREPRNGRVGFAFHIEPGWARIQKVTGEKGTEYELELKAVVQKNFAHDRLVWGGNLTLEPEWEREHPDPAAPDEVDWEKELKLELASGLSYRATPKLWLGVEGRYHSVYPDWIHGLHRENYAVYAGPSVHYAAGEWSVTATWLPQLFGSPGRTGSSLEFHDHEKRELRLKISREF
jgi:hypothetical protein